MYGDAELGAPRECCGEDEERFEGKWGGGNDIRVERVLGGNR